MPGVLSVETGWWRIWRWESRGATTEAFRGFTRTPLRPRRPLGAACPRPARAALPILVSPRIPGKLYANGERNAELSNANKYFAHRHEDCVLTTPRLAVLNPTQPLR